MPNYLSIATGENSRIHIFPKGMIALWNAKSLILELNSGHWDHFLRWLPLHHERFPSFLWKCTAFIYQSGKGVAPFPTPWCSSSWKGSLLFALDYGRHLYLLTHISEETLMKYRNLVTLSCLELKYTYSNMMPQGIIK